LRIVVALGGNALLKRPELLTTGNESTGVRRAAAGLARLCADGHHLIVTHGPEVRPIGLQAIAGPRDNQYPLDPLSGDNERMLGYFIKQELANAPSGSRTSPLSSAEIVGNMRSSKELDHGRAHPGRSLA
jgi:carbamate kinase